MSKLEVRRDGVTVCYGPDKTMPNKEQRVKLRKDGHKIYVDGKLYREYEAQMSSQKKLILEYLRAHGSITPMDAITHCNRCFRLSARIWDLRAEGYNIVTDDKDKDGNPVNYAIYRLEENNA